MNYSAPSRARRFALRNPDAGFSLVTIFSVIVGVLVIVGVGFSIYASVAHTETYSNCVVEDKDRVKNNDGQSEQRIYTENCGVFTVDDNIFIGQVNTADMYSSIKVGETYTFETKGYRIPILSMFPNITKITPSE